MSIDMPEKSKHACRGADNDRYACDRRHWLGRMGGALAVAALGELVAKDIAGPARASEGVGPAQDTRPRPPHFRPRAKAVIQLFMHGGPSQVDLFDPKPVLEKLDGQPFPGAIDVQETDKAGGVLKSPFAFRPHGQSGIEISELLPHTASRADDLCLIRSMHTEHINHEPALWMMHTGETRPGRPVIASWVVYGLGSMAEDLPAYVVLDDPKGLPTDGIRNWSSGWLPPVFQGTRFRSEGPPVWNLHPHRPISEAVQQARRKLLTQLDAAHLAQRPGQPELAARLATYELAARMQLSATEALDLSRETAATQRLYGLENETCRSFGRRCLMARRLVERGVRYVQVFLDGQNWDHHSGIKQGLIDVCARTDQPTAALLADLKQRGLLEETLVLWGGEFGRLPISQSSDGRDHNHRGFTIWMAGGGVKAGHVHGATDEFGYMAVENSVGVRDLHATILHLLGLDHQRLVFPRHGLDERLTGVHTPRIVQELLA